MGQLVMGQQGSTQLVRGQLLGVVVNLSSITTYINLKPS